MSYKGVMALIIVACLLFTSMTMMAVPASAGKPQPPQTLTMESSDPEYDSYYGWSVAFDGNYIVVSAYSETPADLDSAGRVHVYYASNGTLAAILTSPNPEFNGWFGYSVAIASGYIVVGAPQEDVSSFLGAGHAYIYDTSDLSASPITLTSSNPQGDGLFGRAVATDGAYVVIGAMWENHQYDNDGHAYVFAINGTPLAMLYSPNRTGGGGFGKAVAVGDGHIVIGAPSERTTTNVGRVYIYTTSDLSAPTTTLTSVNPKTGGHFGWSVAIDGRNIVVGAPDEDSNSLSGAGNAYVYSISGRLTKTLTSPNAVTGGEFGSSVAIDGRNIVVGAPDEDSNSLSGAGNAYVFTKSGRLTKTLTSPNAITGGYFGISVAMNSGIIIVGAYTEDVGSNTGAGRAYFFS